MVLCASEFRVSFALSWTVATSRWARQRRDGVQFAEFAARDEGKSFCFTGRPGFESKVV